jgi:hypothetical protein
VPTKAKPKAAVKRVPAVQKATAVRRVRKPRPPVRPVLTRAQVLEKVKALGGVTESFRNSYVCNLLGHTKVQKPEGWVNVCARCGAPVFSPTPREGAVILGQDTPEMRENHSLLRWKDLLYAPVAFRCYKRKGGLLWRTWTPQTRRI